MAQLKADGKMIFLIFFGAIIGTVLLVAISDQIVLNTVTDSTVNLTVTLGAINVSTDITGRTLLTRVAVTNASEESSDAANLVIATGIGAGGLESVQILLNDTAVIDGYSESDTVNVSYSYEPDGFVGGGANPILLLVILFGALGALIFVVVQFLNGESVKNILRS